MYQIACNMKPIKIELTNEEFFSLYNIDSWENDDEKSNFDTTIYNAEKNSFKLTLD